MEHQSNESVNQQEEKSKGISLHEIDAKALETISELTSLGYSLRDIKWLGKTLEFKVDLIFDCSR